MVDEIKYLGWELNMLTGMRVAKNFAPVKFPWMTRMPGFSIIEILIFLFILSIGLLGVMSLQGSEKRHNQDSYFRTQAILLAYDMVERLRANMESALGGNYDVRMNDPPPSNPAICKGKSISCRPAQMANYDIAQWKCLLGKWDNQDICRKFLNTHRSLPFGDGSVSRNKEVFVITVQWNDGSGPLPNQFVFNAKL